MNPRSCLWWLGVLALATTVVRAAPSAAGVLDGCNPGFVTNDTLRAYRGGGPILGQAIGQVFLAPETLITEIDVWRPATYQSVIGAHIFITGVDTTRTPA